MEQEVGDVRVSGYSLYLLGLVLRNQQLVTVAVVLLSFLTWAHSCRNHADVSSSGRRIGDENGNDGVQLNSIVALRKISSSRIFEDGEIGGHPPTSRISPI